jgi:hypothetical protein
MTGTRRPTLGDLADLEAENALLLAIVEATSSGRTSSPSPPRSRD